MSTPSNLASPSAGTDGQPSVALAAARSPTNDSMAAVEAAARSDFAAVRGTEVLAKTVSGYRGHDSFDVDLDPPVKVRIEASTVGDIARWNDDWCDPIYQVTVLETHPELAGLRSCWLHGICRHIDGTTTEPADFIALAA